MEGCMGRRGEEAGVAQAYNDERKRFVKCALRFVSPLLSSLDFQESSSKTRRRRQGERHKRKGLMSRTMAVHVRDKSLYSLCRQLEMTKLYVFWRTCTTN